MEVGVEHIHRETYLTSLEVAREVLLAKGRKLESIDRKIRIFTEHDEKVLKQQFEVRHDEKSL